MRTEGELHALLMDEDHELGRHKQLHFGCDSCYELAKKNTKEAKLRARQEKVVELAEELMTLTSRPHLEALLDELGY